MKLLGINFHKISAEREDSLKPTNVNINIKFLNVEKDKLDLLKIDEILKIYFNYNVSYRESEDQTQKPKAELIYEGHVVISVNKEESKEILKTWKKQEIPNPYKTPIFNLILKKCSIRTLNLEEDLNLPFHVPLPKIESK
jgi:hypothetical protein